MSDTISVFNETLREPKDYQVLRLLHELHLALGRRAAKFAFMPQSFLHVLRQSSKVYGAIFEHIENVTQGRNVKESHGRYTCAIRPLEDILLALRDGIRRAPQKRMSELVSDECGENESIPATISNIIGRLEGIRLLLVKTLQDISRDDKFKEVKAPVDVSLSGFDEEFISYIIDLNEMRPSVDIGLTEEVSSELQSVLKDVKGQYGAAMKGTEQEISNIKQIVNHIVTVKITVHINSKTPEGKEKLKAAKFWDKIKRFFRRVKEVLNVPITTETTKGLTSDFGDLEDIIILDTKKPTLDMKLFDNLAVKLPTVQRSFYLQSLVFVNIFGKHFEICKTRNKSQKGYDSMVNKLTNIASATSVALHNARDAQLERLNDESTHRRFSESTFKTAYDRLKELLQEAEGNINELAQSFSDAREKDWKAVQDLKNVMDDDW